MSAFWFCCTSPHNQNEQGFDLLEQTKKGRPSLGFIIQGVPEKTEQIWNCSQRREAAQSMKFLINIDCLGTYDVE